MLGQPSVEAQPQGVYNGSHVHFLRTSYHSYTQTTLLLGQARKHERRLVLNDGSDKGGRVFKSGAEGTRWP